MFYFNEKNKTWEKMWSSYVEVEVQHPSGITTYNSEELLCNSVKRGKGRK